MIDREYLRKVYSDYSTDQLIRHILFEAGEFEPEALEIIKSEFVKREGDINDLIQKENIRSGNIEFKISDVRCFDLARSGKLTGNLFLTSNGIFFIPSKFKKDPPVPLGGLIGIIFAELTSNLPAKNLNEKKINLPLSLLVNYFEHSFGIENDKIKSIRFWQNGDLDIEPIDGKSVGFALDKGKVNQLEYWLLSHNISSTKGEAVSKGFFKKLDLFKKTNMDSYFFPLAYGNFGI